MTKKTDYKIVKETIPVEIEQNSVLNISTNNVTPFTHGFHKYPGKFIPQLPKWAIEKYLDSKQQKTILDPFCGSGTTLVEANLAGHNSIGIDIDPLSALISKVKTTPIDEKKLQKISNWLVDELKVRKEGAFIPECVTIDHWFTKDAIKKLSILRTLIDEISIEFGRAKKTSDIKDLLTICFSSIIRRVSNADNQSQKTYVSHTKPKVPEEVCKLFQKNYNCLLKGLLSFQNTAIKI